MERQRCRGDVHKEMGARTRMRTAVLARFVVIRRVTAVDVIAFNAKRGTDLDPLRTRLTNTIHQRYSKVR